MMTPVVLRPELFYARNAKATVPLRLTILTIKDKTSSPDITASLCLKEKHLVCDTSLLQQVYFRIT